MYNSNNRALLRAPPKLTILKFFKKVLNDWSLDYSSMLAYTFMISLLPIAVTVFGVIAFVPNLRADVKQKILEAFPDNSTRASIQQVLDLASNQLRRDAGGLLALGIVFTIFSTSRLFVLIDNVMQIIYRLEQRGFIKQNLVAIGMVFVFILLIVLIIAAASAPSFLLAPVHQAAGRFGIYIAGIVTSLLLSFILFEVIYLIMPNKKIKIKQTWCGSLVAAVLFEIFIILFPLYVRHFMTNYVGYVGLVIVLLLFFYYFAVILLLGSQINAYWFERIQPFPDAQATFISKMFKLYEMRSGQRK
ncbi:unnamed protein product [Didymodactylos carnosus]|uniref:Uncharacterized protein n=1 Tax=Didymodactylos carnosus TaxID=1234261 RepID=A0A815S1P1_9BILA|nr:unnamed protein product [Didymodactylos carnosus]CAF1485799.1 unnamed protein product [Didymodactylos carnosus]CAF4179042.1 unnamed protein product [Didymodactylos carnosus]CAF4349935.1 unnamed protein product [Didymodactylos carnosus]